MHFQYASVLHQLCHVIFGDATTGDDDELQRQKVSPKARCATDVKREEHAQRPSLLLS